MPRFDKTGPLGLGSKTGRGMGRCHDKKPSVANLNWPGWFSEKRPGRGKGTWNKAFHRKGGETE
jgi:hypothetical protein